MSQVMETWKERINHFPRRNRPNYGSILVQLNQCVIPKSTSSFYDIVIEA